MGYLPLVLGIDNFHRKLFLPHFALAQLQGLRFICRFRVQLPSKTRSSLHLLMELANGTY